MNVSARLLIVCTITILVFMQAVGQEPARIDYPLGLPSTLTVGDLRATSPNTGLLPVKNIGLTPLKTEMRGIAFTGRQGVMILGSGSVALPSVSVGFSLDPMLTRPGSANGNESLWEGFTRLGTVLGGIDRALAATPLELNSAAAASRSPRVLVDLAPGESAELVVEFLCFEPERPDPAPGTTWQVVRDTGHEGQGLAEKQRLLIQLAKGLVLVDAEVAQLAKSVRIRVIGDETELEYLGEPLSEADAHLLRTVDWSVAPDGSTWGVLNRTVVAQFAFWALTDHYTQRDLTRKLGQERFASAQPREASIRWSIRYLLERAGFDPNLFDPPP